MTTSTTSLPQELVDTIVDCFVDSPETLCVLSLAHRIFLHQSQKHLFGTVELANISDEPISPFPCELDPSKDRGVWRAYLLKSSLTCLPSVISHLTLSCGESQSHTHEFLISPITSLRSLKLHDPLFSGDSEAPDDLHLLPSFLKSNIYLHELEISNANIGDLRQLFPYPLSDPAFLPKLDSLTIDNVEFRPTHNKPLSEHVAEILASSSSPPSTSRKIHLRTLNLGSLEPEVLDLWFLHPHSTFDLTYIPSETSCPCQKCSRLLTLRFLPLNNELSEDYIDFLTRMGENVDNLELRRGWDWHSRIIPLPGSPIIPNVTRLTIECSESRRCPGFLPWISTVIRDTKVKHLTFCVDQLDTPVLDLGRDEEAAEEDPDQGYMDPEDNEGHEEEDDGVRSEIENNVFDEELAELLEGIANGDPELQTPFGKSSNDEKFQISFLVQIPGKDAVKRYLPQAWDKANTLGIVEMDLVVLGDGKD